jgi:hypothetical protein
MWPARYAQPAALEHHLRAKVREMRRRGEIDPTMIRYRQEGTEVVAYVMRTRPPVKRMPRALVAGGLALSAMTGIGVLLWESRHVLLCLLVAALGVWWAATRGGHAGLCPGLHCPGCRG